MSPAPPERFERDYGCTEAEWLRWLPEAVSPARLTVQGASAEADFGDGWLRLSWRIGPERRIALVRLPSLLVAFAFEGLGSGRRAEVMRAFDLRTQRGGG